MKLVKGIHITFLALGLLGLCANVSAHEPGTGGVSDGIIVTRHFTGLWDQVDQEAQGFALQVIEQRDDSRRAVAYWYTYGDDRQTAWFLAIGDLIGNRIEFNLFDSTDVGFMQDALPGDDSVHYIGTMTMSFDSCNSGEVTFATDHAAVGNGSFRIERIAEIMNTHCSGGISDDMHADAMFGEQALELTPARDGISGIGYALYKMFHGYIEFDVEVEGLPDGDYSLFVGSEERGNILVEQGMGEIEFTSPEEDGTALLNFDPRGQLIEVHDVAGVVLSSHNQVLETQGHHYGGHHGGDGDHNYDCQYGPGHGHGHGMGGGMHDGPGMGGMHNCVDDGDSIEIQADLLDFGGIPGAVARAEWDMNSHRVQFSVELENVPVGSYTLKVGGVQAGVIETFQMHFGVYGRLSFRDPQAYGMRHLDFEPRGELIQVLQGDTVILEASFPLE